MVGIDVGAGTGIIVDCVGMLSRVIDLMVILHRVDR